jgi:acyl transferase domain-containing protein/acyl carrier protein
MEEDTTSTISENGRTGLEIAIIGMAGRFPGAEHVGQFWENLKNGIESIGFFSDEELLESGLEPELVKNSGYVKAKGLLEEIEYFDAHFFEYLPHNVEYMDPQVRVFHEIVWEALENAGYNPEDYGGSIGVYAGSSFNMEYINRLYSLGNNPLLQQEVFSLNLREYLSTRISYKFNLRGPSVAVNTACSTSLVAVHMACQALLNGECNMALAGSVTISLPEKSGYLYREGMVLSPDGHCRAFDANANGTIFGSGAGVVVLKTLEDAAADGDTIYALIKGSAINNDGAQKVGFTAPAINGQAEVIKNALYMAELEPSSIGYVETHGTGTALGDSIEIEALKRAFNNTGKGFCRIGSVKTNVGHLETAAGVAGLIKTALSLKHKIIPPSLHFHSPDPESDLKNSPFEVNKELTPWNTDRLPRRAGVSSFGIGGTNVHMVLEEWPGAQSAERSAQGTEHMEHGELSQGRGEVSSPITSKEFQLIVLSAKTENSLQKTAENLGKFLKENPGINLPDVAYTLQVGRKHFQHRQMFVCSSPGEAVEILSPPHSGKLFSARLEKTKQKVVFMFSGQGSQYVNMGWGLYQKEPVFRQEMDRCFEILKPLMGYDIKRVLYPSPGINRSNKSYMSYIPEINQTEIAQPLLFIFEFALARLLIKWGITPCAMIGHSIGEYTAACLSGVLSLEDALKLVVLRGRLMQALPAGSMVSVSLSESQLKPLLGSGLAVAAVNAPGRCVISGPHQAVKEFAAQLQGKGYKCQMLHTSHAFHSSMMDPMLKEFEENVKQVTLNQPDIPYISNVTGTWVTGEQALDPGYWAAHVRQTVKFSSGIRTLLDKSNTIFVEIGPGKALNTLTRQHTNTNPDKQLEAPVQVLNLVRHPNANMSDTYFLQDKIGRLWLWGLQINWHEFHSGENEKRYRVPIPTYPFERIRYGIKHQQSEIEGRNTDDLKRNPMDQWFYIPSWKRMDLPINRNGNEIPTRCRLVFQDECGVGLKIIEQLKEKYGPVVVVKPGKEYEKTGNEKSGVSTVTINPGQPQHFERLFNQLHQKDIVPEEILFCWGITPDNPGPASMERVEQVLDLVFYSLLNIARAHAAELVKAGNLEQVAARKLQVTAITNHLQEVNGTEEIHPEKAAILGAVGVIPREYPYIRCRTIDIVLPSTDTPEEEQLLHQLMAELSVTSPDTTTALRDRHRWVQTFEPVSLAKPGKELPFLRDKGVYLVTGGFGGIGFVLARYLAETLKPRIIIISRRTPTPNEKKRIEELENLGAEVLVYSADVSLQDRMEEVFRQVLERFGTIHGIIHAAGIADYAGVIPRRTREQSEEVLAPKIKGTLVMEELLTKMNIKPDFFMLYSSLISIIAPLGQVAYAAANAFLDAFAHQQQINPDKQTYTVSINWDSWQEVGMAVKAVEKLTASRELAGYQPLPVNHPLFEKRLSARASDEEIFISYLRVDKHWVIDEHRILENAVLPGVAYLEIIKAAFEHFAGERKNEHMDSGMMEIRNLIFSQPLMVQKEEEKEVRTILIKQAEGFQFRVISRMFPGKEEWQEHASGTVFLLPPATPITHQIKKIEEKCGGNWITHERVEETGSFTPSTHLHRLGPRWQNIKAGMISGNQGLVQLELPTEFNRDLQFYRLHPALLDCATSFLVNQVQSEQYHLPFSYKKVRTGIHTHLPGKIYSRAVFVNGEKQEPDSHKKTLEFNIIIMDELGTELMTIESFILLSVPKDKSTQTFPGPKEEKEPGPNQLQDAIRPGEGIEIVKRILSSSYPQVLVSTRHFSRVLEKSREFQLPDLQEELAIKKPGTPTHPRPALSNPYVPPTNATQQTLANIWQNFFGIQQVGILDDFFELGGDSLRAMGVVTQIHKELDVEVPITEFFTRPIIKNLAEYINNTRKSKFYRIQTLEKQEFYPLSSSTKRLYFLQDLEKKNISYNQQKVFVLEGECNIKMLEQACRKIIQRHESLRTSFEMKDDDPVQRIHDEVSFQIQYHEVEKAGVDQVINDFTRPYDLSKPPLFRLGLISVGEKKYIMMWDFHHIISDAISSTLFQKELMMIYLGEVLPPLSIHYKEYCRWVNRKKESSASKQMESYWLKEFEGDLPELAMPTDFARPDIQSFIGKIRFFELSKEETKAIKVLAANNEVTLFMIIFALYNVLLSKLSGQEDIIVGTPSAGRGHPDLENIIGMFVNTLAIRNYPVWQKTFIEFLKEVKEKTLKAFENQDYQFDDLVEKVALKRDISRNPLFDVLFQFENFDSPGFEIPGLTLKPYSYENKISKFDMTFYAVESGDTLSFKIEYNNKLFKDETVQWFFHYFKEIVTSAISQPDSAISEMGIIAEEENDETRAQLMDDLENE